MAESSEVKKNKVTSRIYLDKEGNYCCSFCNAIVMKPSYVITPDFVVSEKDFENVEFEC